MLHDRRYRHDQPHRDGGFPFRHGRDRRARRRGLRRARCDRCRSCLCRRRCCVRHVPRDRPRGTRAVPRADCRGNPGDRRRSDRGGNARKRLAARPAGGRTRPHDRAAQAVRRGRAQRRVARPADRSCLARAAASAAPRSALADDPARPGRRVRSIELPAGLLDRRRGHRIGARRRVPGRRQRPSGASRHGRAGRRRDPPGGGRVRIARGRFLASGRAGQRSRQRPGRGPAHRRGRLHRVADRGPGAARAGTSPPGADPRLCRNVEHQPGPVAAGRARGARRGARHGFRRVVDHGGWAVLHQPWTLCWRSTGTASMPSSLRPAKR